jgi:hypothetical protein
MESSNGTTEHSKGWFVIHLRRSPTEQFSLILRLTSSTLEAPRSDTPLLTNGTTNGEETHEEDQNGGGSL